MIIPEKKATHNQIPLDLGIEIQGDINGVEMGVLENGIPYLTQRGLARITGAARSLIQTITQEWEDHFSDPVIRKDRISFFKNYLFQNGYQEPKLFLGTVKDGSIHYIYPDIVCMAFLEYYAFESKGSNETALTSYRQFAAYGLRKYIYEALGYAPLDKWKYHHDRISILSDSSPDGYFTVFNEVTGLIVDLINAGLTVNDKTIPDISVGLAWSKHWKANNFDQTFGVKIPYSHNYPSYYPQAASNPQLPNAYPDASLPEFRRWFRQEYLPTKFPKYLLTKASVIKGGEIEVQKIANLFTKKLINPPS